MIKAIATDLDGTLFYPRRKVRLISSANKQFIQNAIQEGKEVILVTGRNYGIAKKVEKAIGMDKSISIVACNGSVISHQDEIIKEDFISGQEALDFCKKFEGNKDIKTWMFFTSDQLLLVDASPVSGPMRLMGWIGMNLQGAYSEPHVFGKKKTIEILSNPDCKIYKMMAWFGLGKKGHNTAKAYRETLREEYKQYSFAWSGQVVEIVRAGVNKAKSLKELLESLNIDSSEVAVVGDSGNDISLFREFENSFVMEQAADSVKKEAKTVVKSVADLKNYIK